MASTIYALSSAPGRAGVAVVRVSGPAVRDVLGLMSAPVPAPSQAVFRTIRHPVSKDALDRAVVLFFAAPRSETGEDVAEFQVHGGRAVVAAVLEGLACVPGCRIAGPGEFVRRAFLNGKLDLAEVEGVADLVDAETEAQRVQALAQSSGALSKLYEGWRKSAIEAMALVEAAIDFADEGDVSKRAMVEAGAQVRALMGVLEAHLADGRRGEILREGFRVALLGAPNAGKSSLLNALARREAAIVSDEAGTTRDVVEVRLDLGGYPVIVSDTAGLREARGAVEREGMRRSLVAAHEADLVLWLVEPGGEFESRVVESRKVSREISAPVLTVLTKADTLIASSDLPFTPDAPLTLDDGPLALDDAPLALDDAPLTLDDAPLTLDDAPLALDDGPLALDDGPLALDDGPLALDDAPLTLDDAPLTPTLSPRGEGDDASDSTSGSLPPLRDTSPSRGEESVLISTKTGQGLDALVARISAAAADRLANRAGPPLTQARHREALQACLASLGAFLSGDLAGDPDQPELRAEDLRRAAHALGRITGRVDVEDVLGAIFGRFCIGK